MVKVKCCGMTNLDDCKRAIDLGVEYAGFVFYRKSSRCLAPETAQFLVERIRGSITTVGVFVEESDEEIARVVNDCGLDLAQVYRPCALPNTITAVRVADTLPRMPEGEGLILLDAYTDGFGGSGRSFDFRLLKGSDVLRRAFVAGGIGERNVCDVLRLQPFAIDLVSSIESSAGRKDHQKMERFMNIVRSFAI